MHIAIDLRSLQSGKISGVENYAFNLVGNLLALDKKNFYTFFFNGWHKSLAPDLNFVNSSTKITKLPNKLLNFMLKTNLVCLENIIGGFDCLLLPNLGWFNIKPETKLVITVHDLSPVIFPEFYNLKRRLWHRYLNFQKSYQRADLIFAVSECTKADLIRLFGVEDKKIKVINPGIDHEIFKLQTPEARRRLRNQYCLPGDFLLFLNTLEPRKNLDNLIKAFERLSEPVSLVIAGKKGWKDKNIFKALRHSKKSHKILYLGYVDERDKPGLISMAKALVYPSFYEGFGFQPLEAFACGTPAIVSQIASLPEIVRDCALLVNPYSIQDLCKALSRILNDQLLRRLLTQKGEARARDFNWEYTAARTLKELNNL
jgi:glycosyltransferase involved in cell wall biosynthesis